ncbi:MAG: HNH endonuclease, partial [bacterium]|nr:HNH endonuclease [bacterium]
PHQMKTITTGYTKKLTDPSPAPSGDEAGVVGEDGTYVEGSEVMVAVLAYERNAEARQKCIDIHGTRCKVCDIDFGEEYGEFADGYIHLHHIVPLAQAAKDGEYKVDPIDDLVPVCPNCHAMLHRHDDKPCTIETLRAIRESRQ